MEKIHRVNIPGGDEIIDRLKHCETDEDMSLEDMQAVLKWLDDIRDGLVEAEKHIENGDKVILVAGNPTMN